MGNCLPDNKDMKTAYRDLRAQHPHPVPERIPYTATGSKQEPVPALRGTVPPPTLLLAPKEAKPTETSITIHGAKWRIPQHHMTPQDLPAGPYCTS